VIGIRRTEVRPFTDRQIDLVKTFADQAVIAIENTRLFEAEQTRTRELTERTQELTEALEYQTATSDVLAVISRSKFDLQPVIDTLVQAAGRLCDAGAWLFRRQGNAYRWAASYGFSVEQHERIKTYFIEKTFVPDRRGLTSMRAAFEGSPVHIQDVLADPEYTHTEAQEVGGFRTTLGVPLLRDGVVMGVLALTRSEVRPFTDKQIELITTFADQAVIAIENTRLFEAEQASKRELQESLAYQTATSEVLNVISRSPTELQPVLDAIAAPAARLCEFMDATVWRVAGGRVRVVAEFGSATNAAHPLTRGSVTGRAIVDRKNIHVHDLAAMVETEYPDVKEIQQRVGHRTTLATPLLSQGEALGAISLRKNHVHPFSDRQMALLQTFADQAVIAIENARLFEEVQARIRELAVALEQQIATSELLKVIGRSTFDLQPVFETLAENAVKLCESERSFIFRFDGQLLRVVATHNASVEIRAFVEQNPIAPGTGSATARAALYRRTVHIHDAQADPDYTFGSRKVDLFRTIMTVPILRVDELLGVILIYRHEVRPFTPGQIALLETFADQAGSRSRTPVLCRRCRHATVS
jgi:GAF domain-containing protein